MTINLGQEKVTNMINFIKRKEYTRGSLPFLLCTSSTYYACHSCLKYEGVAVGCGWQAFVAYVNVGCYYLVGIPLGSLLGFYFQLGAKVN